MSTVSVCVLNLYICLIVLCCVCVHLSVYMCAESITFKIKMHKNRESIYSLAVVLDHDDIQC